MVSQGSSAAMRATVTDISRLTGFAPGTVSRALDTTGKYPVSEATRQKVYEAAKQLRYRPNLIGRALVAGSSKLVSMISLAPFSEYYTLLARHVSACALRDGYCLVNMVSFDPESTFQFGEINQVIPSQDWIYGTDGILVCDPGDWQLEVIERAIDMNIPVVGLGYRAEQNADWVRVNLFDAMVALISHLIEQGNRSIVMISSTMDENEVRMAAYVQTMKSHGLACKVRYIAQQRRKDGREAASAEIAENGAPDAFICVNDVVAIGCCRGVQDAGLRIPEDVSVAGCDGIEDGQYLQAPLTTITQPIALAAEQAWEFLKERIDGYDGPRREVDLPAALTLAASTHVSRL